MKVLVTGGAGYIGSTTCSALEDAGHVPVVLDSLVTGQRVFIGNRAFVEGDVGDPSTIDQALEEHPEIECTIHMAARVVVSESVREPALYYRENVSKSLVLFERLARRGRPAVVFSSSASVYGPTELFEVDESSTLGPGSPYARSKMMTESVMKDLCTAGQIRGVVLRHFNPIGADPLTRSGAHLARPTHVLGQLIMAARGPTGAFRVTGTDLPTRDGTGLRDYIHVWDLARAHVAAVERFEVALSRAQAPFGIVNVGTGSGVTVRELITAFRSVLGTDLRTLDGPSRPGDPVGAFACVGRAQDWLGWSAELSLEDGIRTGLQWAGLRDQLLGNSSEGWPSRSEP